VLAAGIAASLAAGVSAYGVHAARNPTGEIAGKLEVQPMMGEVTAIQGGVSGRLQDPQPGVPEVDAPDPRAHVPMKLSR
jgi:hypothetical protein